MQQPCPVCSPGQKVPLVITERHGDTMTVFLCGQVKVVATTISPAQGETASASTLPLRDLVLVTECRNPANEESLSFCALNMHSLTFKGCYDNSFFCRLVLVPNSLKETLAYLNWHLQREVIPAVGRKNTGFTKCLRPKTLKLHKSNETLSWQGN